MLERNVSGGSVLQPELCGRKSGYSVEGAAEITAVAETAGCYNLIYGHVGFDKVLLRSSNSAGEQISHDRITGCFFK